MILALLLAGLLVATPATADDKFIQGRVVDAETKQPLEGAVVTVIWLKYPFIIMNGGYNFHDAREALTDADGRFSIDRKPRWNWNPFGGLKQHPEIIIFKPGYGPYPEMYGPSAPVVSDPEGLYVGRFATVTLPKLTTRQELIRFSSPSLSSSVPEKRVPLLMRLYEQQRVTLGLEPLQEPKDRR